MLRSLSERKSEGKARRTVSQAAEEWRLKYCAFALGIPEEEVKGLKIKVGTKGERGTCAWYISEKRKLISRIFERMPLEELKRIAKELGYA